MKVLAILILSFYISSLYAQVSNINALTHKFLALDIYKVNSVKRIKFYENDKIIVKVKTYQGKFKGVITNLNDTGLTLDNTMIISYNDIKKILIDKSNFLIRLTGNFIRVAGGGYILLDVVNNLINSDSPIINIRTVIIGCSLIVTGGAIRWLSVSRYKIDKRHTIKFIDDTPN